MFNFKLIAMHKTLLLLCAIVLTLGVFAQRSKGNITVTTPPGWAKVQGSVLEHQYLKNGASFMIKEETQLNGKTLGNAVNTAKQQIGKYFSDASFAKDEFLKVDGQDAQSTTYTYTAKAGGMVLKMKMQSIYVMVNGKCQNISFGSTADSFGMLAKDIPIILKGIKFKK